MPGGVETLRRRRRARFRQSSRNRYIDSWPADIHTHSVRMPQQNETGKPRLSPSSAHRWELTSEWVTYYYMFLGANRKPYDSTSISANDILIRWSSITCVMRKQEQHCWGHPHAASHSHLNFPAHLHPRFSQCRLYWSNTLGSAITSIHETIGRLAPDHPTLCPHNRS